eukprot:6377827-Alexandrium_andersonii.AAC.1
MSAAANAISSNRRSSNPQSTQSLAAGAREPIRSGLDGPGEICRHRLRRGRSGHLQSLSFASQVRQVARAFHKSIRHP